jgi:hypothetical protein
MCDRSHLKYENVKPDIDKVIEVAALCVRADTDPRSLMRCSRMPIRALARTKAFSS